MSRKPYNCVQRRYYEHIRSLRIGSTIYFWNKENEVGKWWDTARDAYMHRIFLNDDENISEYDDVRTPYFDGAWEFFSIQSVPGYCIFDE